MKRILGILGLIFGIGLLPALMGPSGGFPSRPDFQAIGIGAAAPATGRAVFAAPTTGSTIIAQNSEAGAAYGLFLQDTNGTPVNGIGIRFDNNGLTKGVIATGPLASANQNCVVGNFCMSAIAGALTLQTANLTMTIPNGGPLVFIGSGNTATTVGATGAASALPANPLGYMLVTINGTSARIPYYN